MRKKIRRNPPKNEKTPSKVLTTAQKEIFSEKSGHLVQMNGHAALLAGSSILVQKTLGHGLVASLDGSHVGSLGSSLLTPGHGGLKLLNGSLQSGLVGLVLLICDLGSDDILLRGLNVGHGYTSCSPIWFIQIHIIAC